MAHVLVVDDNLDTCELLARVLRRTGHSATCQSSAAAALASLRSQPTDLVILDVMMPGMTGLEVLAAIRADARLAAVKVLMFTALSDAKTQAEARRLGAVGYIIKGVGWPVLLGEIQRLIGGETLRLKPATAPEGEGPGPAAAAQTPRPTR